MTADDGFDRDALPHLERMVGEAALSEVLDLYFKNSPERLSRVRNGLAGGDLADVAHALHDVKSSGGMVGANALQQLAERMERLAREGRAEEVLALVDDLEREAARADTLLHEARERRRT